MYKFKVEQNLGSLKIMQLELKNQTILKEHFTMFKFLRKNNPMSQN